MVDEQSTPTVRQIPANKQYVVPPERISDVPAFHANFVQMAVSNEEATLVFCIKEDTIATADDSNVALPQVCVFLSFQQAELLNAKLGVLLERVRQAVASAPGGGAS